MLDLDTGEERRVPGASTGAASEMLPSVWRDEIAFARVFERRAGERDGYDLSELPYLYVHDPRGP